MTGAAAPAHSRSGWLLTGVVLALAAVGVPLAAVAGVPLSDALPSAGVAVAFVVPGGLLAVRQPRNPTGWLLLTAALGQALDVALVGYGRYAVLAHPGALPLGLAVWTVGSAGWWMLLFLSVPLLLMLFPDGTLPSPRWRPLARALVVLTGAAVAAAAMAFDHLGDDRSAPRNPAGHLVPAAVPLSVMTAAGLLILGATVAAVISLVGRTRRATGVVRAQYRWFLLGTGACAVCFAAAFVPGLPELVVPGVAAFLGCLTVAMLRYRLYDIGRLVSRTISYALLSALLAGSYLAVVGLITSLLPTAGSFAVAAATLVVAAAFNPVRRRLQAGVDRRFNRSRYDSARTVDGFAQRLRTEVDLDTLLRDLRAVVHQTMEPSSSQVWLRDQSLGPAGPTAPGSA